MVVIVLGYALCMDSHKNHEASVQMAKWLEQMSDHNECCSAFSPQSVFALDLCERHTFKKQRVTEL